VENLPENRTWEDLVERIHVREAIEAGLADVEAGRTAPHEEVLERFRSSAVIVR
jgi:predicted transcriptional regulator